MNRVKPEIRLTHLRDNSSMNNKKTLSKEMQKWNLNNQEVLKARTDKKEKLGTSNSENENAPVASEEEE